MSDHELRPSWTVDVEVSFGHPNYVLLAEWMYPGGGAWWEELGDILGGRPGWHCQLTSEGLLWSFGGVGQSLFNITWHGTEDDAPVGFELFDYDADETYAFANTLELVRWLEANEHRHADHLRSLHGLVAPDDWALLKSYPWKANISHDAGTWVGTVVGIPADATFAPTLPGLLGNLRELIAAAFNAPADVARDITLSVRLDQAATQAAGA